MQGNGVAVCVKSRMHARRIVRFRAARTVSSRHLLHFRVARHLRTLAWERPMTTRFLLMLLTGIAIMCAQGPGQKAPPKRAKAEVVNYYQDVEPILKASCESCHQAAMAAGGLRLDAPENMLQGGASGPAVIPGKAQSSLLYTRLTDTTAKRMPPVGALTEEQLAIIRAWINLGAKIDRAVNH